MNIFVTDECPVKSAIALPNILVNKMCQEWQSRTDKRPIIATWVGRNKPDWVHDPVGSQQYFEECLDKWENMK